MAVSAGQEQRKLHMLAASSASASRMEPVLNPEPLWNGSDFRAPAVTADSAVSHASVCCSPGLPSAPDKGKSVTLPPQSADTCRSFPARYSIFERKPIPEFKSTGPAVYPTAAVETWGVRDTKQN